jgi:hypothetical protein
MGSKNDYPGFDGCRSPDTGVILIYLQLHSNSSAASSRQMSNQRNYKKHQENEEQNLGDTRSRYGHATEPKNRGHNCYYEKD